MNCPRNYENSNRIRLEREAIPNNRAQSAERLNFLWNSRTFANLLNFLNGFALFIVKSLVINYGRTAANPIIRDVAY